MKGMRVQRAPVDPALQRRFRQAMKPFLVANSAIFLVFLAAVVELNRRQSTVGYVLLGIAVAAMFATGLWLVWRIQQIKPLS